ncbi:MAG: alpha/beta fold hydrolase [Planctomycetes bacterium]|nr:alpha/beta fold hydrolase [Planctomycetota bacterium]
MTEGAAACVAGAGSVTRREVVLRAGAARLLRLEGAVGPRWPLPVVLVPSIINRPDILDLAPGQSLAAHLLSRGLDVYLVDWGQPGATEARMGLGGHALGLLPRLLQGVLAHRGAPTAHLFGYCLGGTFALMAAARGTPGIASVLALAAPVDLSDPGPLGRLTDPRLLDLERLEAAFPVVPGAMLWWGFQSLDPVGIGRKWRGLMARASDAGFVARFAAQEAWLAAPVDVGARVLAEVVGRLYRANDLARGRLVLDGVPVRLGEGRVPVLNLIAAADTIVPPAASRALSGLWGGEVRTREFPGGHVGVTVGSQAPRRMWAEAARWLEERQPGGPPGGGHA